MGLSVSKLAAQSPFRSSTQIKRQFPTRIPQLSNLKQDGKLPPTDLAQQPVEINYNSKQLGNQHDGLESSHSQRLQHLQQGQFANFPSSLLSTQIKNGPAGRIVQSPSKTMADFNRAINHSKTISHQTSNSLEADSVQPSDRKLGSIKAELDHNHSVLFLTARQQLAAEADAEFSRLGKSAHEGRQFLDVGNIRQIIEMRLEKSGMTDSDIEKSLGLKVGTVIKLGNKSVVSVVG